MAIVKSDIGGNITVSILFCKKLLLMSGNVSFIIVTGYVYYHAFNGINHIYSR